LILAQNERWR